MSTKLEKRIDAMNGTRSEREPILQLQLQPFKINNPLRRIYQVISDNETTRLIEHDVVRVGGGKTKYTATTKILEQSKRYYLNTPPFKVDIFEDSNTTETYIYKEGGKEYTITSHFFTDKDKAIRRRQYEGFKLLMGAINNTPNKAA